MKHREFGWTKNIHMFNGTLVVGKPDTVYRPISQSTFLVLHHGLLSEYTDSYIVQYNSIVYDSYTHDILLVYEKIKFEA